MNNKSALFLNQYIKKFLNYFRLVISFKDFPIFILIHVLNYTIDTAIFLKITQSTRLFNFYHHSKLETLITLFLNIAPILLLVLFLSRFLKHINFAIISLSKLVLLIFIYPMIIKNDFFTYDQRIRLVLIILASFYLLINRLYIIAKTAFLSRKTRDDYRYIVNYVLNFFNFLAIIFGTSIGLLSTKLHIFTVVLSTYLFLIILSCFKVLLSFNIPSIKQTRTITYKSTLRQEKSLILPLIENVFFRVLFGYLLSFSFYYYSDHTQLKYITSALLLGSFCNLFIYKLQNKEPGLLLDIGAGVLVVLGAALIFEQAFLLLFFFSIILGCAYSFGRVLIDVLLQKSVASSNTDSKLIMIAQCDNILQVSWLFGIFLMLITSSFSSIKVSISVLYSIAFLFFLMIIYLKLRNRD